MFYTYLLFINELSFKSNGIDQFIRKKKKLHLLLLKVILQTSD
jgi:hypothetical protein